MDSEKRVDILRSILNDCLYQIEKKEQRMRVWQPLEYPKMQRAENIDRAIFGFLGPLSLLRSRTYKDENIDRWVEKEVSEIMGVFYRFRDECITARQKLESGMFSIDEIEQKIIWFINQKEKLFAPTISDLQSATLLEDLNYLKKHGYEIAYDKKGNKVIKKSNK